MTGDGWIEAGLLEGMPDDALEDLEHYFAVLLGIPLRPKEVTTVLLHFLRTGEKDGEIPIRELRVVGKLPRPPDVNFREGFTDVTGTRVKHEPHELLGVETELDAIQSRKAAIER